MKEPSDFKFYADLSDELKNEILREQFDKALKYSKIKKEGVILRHWIMKKANELQIGRILVTLNTQGQIQLESLKGSNSIEGVIDYYLEFEEDEVERKMLRKTEEICRTISDIQNRVSNFSLWLDLEEMWLEPRNSYNDSRFLTDEKAEDRINKIMRVAKTDEDMIVPSMEEIKMRMLFGNKQEICDELHINFCDYCDVKQRDFEKFTTYLLKKIRQKEKEINEELAEIDFVSEIKNSLEKKAKVNVGGEKAAELI